MVEEDGEALFEKGFEDVEEGWEGGLARGGRDCDCVQVAEDAGGPEEEM